MIEFARITIPAHVARAHASYDTPEAVVDQGYRIKRSLEMIFGENAIRPWRLITQNDRVFVVVGVVADPSAIVADKTIQKMGVVARTAKWDPAEGDTIGLDIMANPVKRITLRDIETREKVRTLFADVSVKRIEGMHHVFVPAKGDELKAAYAMWLAETLMQPERGVEPIDIPVIGSTQPVRVMRKVGPEIKSIQTSCMRATVDVRVTDPVALQAFVGKGLKKLKDVGFGAVIPTSVMQEFAA